MNTEDLTKDFLNAVRMFLNQEINKYEMEYALDKYDLIKDKLALFKDIKTALEFVLSEYELVADIDSLIKEHISNRKDGN